MSASSWLAGTRQADALPKEIYASHVEALYSDARSLLIGVTAACLTALVTAVQTGQWPTFVIAFALAVLGGARLHAMRTFARARPTLDHAGLRTWEAWYVAGGSAHLALLGCFCLVSFVLSDDAAARLASMSITMAYLVGTPGRSFASDFLVNAQILAAGIPVLIALVIAGPRYWVVVLCVMIPFFMALKTISTRLRGIFLSAVLRARALSELNGQFDTALNNMPQGLAMYDADGSVSVTNGRLFALLGLPADAIGTIDLLLAACRAGATPMADGAMPAGPEWRAGNAEWVQEMSDGRFIAFTLQPMTTGGGVVIADDVTDRVRSEANINYLARFDQLTSLPNRHSFGEVVRATLSSPRDRGCAVLFVDLDQFKQVNDTLGHAVGDKLLQSVSERLLRIVRRPGIVARFGGDEFVLCQTFDDPREGAAALASTIIERLSEPFETLGHRIIIGASIGIAVVPEGGGTVDDLLRDADLALYRAKSEGRRTFRFFEGAMQVQAQSRREIEKDLREALGRDEMCLHFQPIFDMAAERFTVCEALLRWRHPHRGMISPAEFIPVAEEMGLIAEIGDWVLREAARECTRWPADVRVAVNLSAVQFRRGGVLASVHRAIAEAGISPDRLEIEITETALLHDLPSTRTTLLQLREAGIRLALDDFGTGYSSLSYLQLLPFMKIKLDRSFLQGLDGGKGSVILLGGIARLCKDLGMAVVMEGVETAEQLALVHGQAGIDEIQGYYYARPMPGEQIRRLLGGQRLKAA